MDEDSLLKKIEKTRQEMYQLSKNSDLNSQVMVDCSQRLDQLLNLYQKKYAIHSYKDKQQGH
ncbi:MAG TPA: aspartyl-phosphate phosphatase Spo0E family protein [Bacillota bacterium]|nr:aspartyl-phosphate phosphatase Spo0E family protein [Bacillota bacterium]